MILETYSNRFALGSCSVLRWSLPEFRIAVGGNVQSREDWEHLERQFGLSHCLDVEAGRENDDRVPRGKYLKAASVDNGRPFAAVAMHRARQFARGVLESGGSLYIHCHMGMSRSPAFAYLVLRDFHSLSAAAALAALDAEYPHGPGYLFDPKHRAYIDSIEAYLSGVS